MGLGKIPRSRPLRPVFFFLARSMKECVENMKEYEEISRYIESEYSHNIGSRTWKNSEPPPHGSSGTWKNSELSPLIGSRTWKKSDLLSRMGSGT